MKSFSLNPKKKILLSIEGNIGAGKTTFLRLMNENIKIPFEVIPEPVNDWQNLGDNKMKINLLDLFYKEPKKYGYIFQSYCFFSRLKNWTKNQDKFDQSVLIFERSIYSDKSFPINLKKFRYFLFRHIFAINAHNNGFFNEVEWVMYNEWYDFLVNHLASQMHGIIYLQTTPEMCLRRTQKRARLGEDKISIDYFKQLHKLHENWIEEEEKRKEIKVLRLNTDDEFETNEKNKELLIESMKGFLDTLIKDN